MNSSRMYYLDTSAMAKLYVAESGSPYMLSLLESVPTGGVVISRLSVVEVASALVRRSRHGEIGEQALHTALRLLDEDTAVFQIIELGGATMSRAISLVREHGLRAADAIQLACALLARGERGKEDGLTLVSADQELNGAAEQEGLTVLNPASV